MSTIQQRIAKISERGLGGLREEKKTYLGLFTSSTLSTKTYVKYAFNRV